MRATGRCWRRSKTRRAETTGGPSTPCGGQREGPRGRRGAPAGRRPRQRRAAAATTHRPASQGRSARRRRAATRAPVKQRASRAGRTRRLRPPDRPHRPQLLLALRRSRQHQVRDVDAGDQQHEDHGAPEQQQYRAHRFDPPHLQRNDLRANARIRAWMVDRQARRDGVHLRLRLRERNLRPDPRDHVPPAAAADVGLVLGDRLGQVEVAIAAAPFETELEIRRQHAHHRIRLPVERQRAAEDAGVAAEAALPEPVGDYHDAAAGAELLRKERPAVRGAGAERLEEAFRDERRVEHLRLSVAGEVERIGLDGRHALEAPGLRTPV